MSEPVPEPESLRPHATGAPEPDPKRPSYAEAARTLLVQNEQGVLATLDAHGYPYTSVVELLPLPDGDALFLLSDLAEHTKNLRRDPKTSLLVAPDLGDERVLAGARLSLVGTLQEEGEEHREAYREAYLERHPDAASYVAFSDFRFYRLRPERAYFIGGFGRMGWADGESYRAAPPDPLSGAAGGILEHMNGDHEHNLVGYARAFAGLHWAERAHMLSVDRYGFDMEVRGHREGNARVRTVRLSFEEMASSPKQVRAELVRLAQRAREVLEAAGE